MGGRDSYRVHKRSKQLVLLTREPLLPLLVDHVFEAEQVDGLVLLNHLQALDGALADWLLELLPRKQGKRRLDAPRKQEQASGVSAEREKQNKQTIQRKKQT